MDKSKIPQFAFLFFNSWRRNLTNTQFCFQSSLLVGFYDSGGPFGCANVKKIKLLRCVAFQGTPSSATTGSQQDCLVGNMFCTKKKYLSIPQSLHLFLFYTQESRALLDWSFPIDGHTSVITALIHRDIWPSVPLWLNQCSNEQVLVLYWHTVTRNVRQSRESVIKSKWSSFTGNISPQGVLGF